MRLLKIFKASKYVLLIAIVSALAGQVLMLYIGVVKTYEAFKAYLLDATFEGLPEHITRSDVATAYLIQALDAFLISVVLLYFAFSLFHLLLSEDREASARLFPGGLAPRSIGDLKQVLAEIVIVILFILFLQEIWVELNNLKWELLVVPASIALLAASVKLLNFRH